MKNYTLFIILLFLCACSSVKNEAENMSFEKRFDNAKLLFESGKYEKAKNQFQIIIENDKTSSLSLESYFLIGKSYLEIKDYEEALYHLNYFSMFSNDIVKVEEAQFLKSKCNFELTLDYKNDQTQTELAIKVIQEFLDNFPNTIYYSNASDMIIDLRDKLAKKNYEDGRLYLKIKKYDSALYYFDIVISEYYDTKYCDDSKISKIFTYILSDDYDKAKAYYNQISDTFISDDKNKEAKDMLSDFKNGLGLSGYYRLYK